MADLIMKQARAIVDDRTTVICLDIHGIVMPVDAPFETLAGDFMQPPFHVHCRTLVGPHMPGFIAEARRAANKELKTRPKSERRRGPDGPAGQIPGPVTKNPPSGFSRRDEEAAFKPGAKAEPFRGKPDPVAPKQDPWAPDVTVLPKAPPKPLSKDAAAAMIDAAYVEPTVEEHAAVGLYMAGMTWSQDLRNGTASEYTLERVGQVHALIEKQLPFAQTVALYRGMSRQYLPGDLQEMVGTVIKDRGLLSTSLDKEVAGLFAGTGHGVMLEILAPEGSRGLSVNHARLGDQSDVPEQYRQAPAVLGGESEIILRAGTAMKVVQVTRRKVEHGFVDTLQVVIVDE